MTTTPTPACYCGHVRHINGRGLCLARGCFCLIYRPTVGSRPSEENAR